MRCRETAALLSEFRANTNVGIPETVQERLRDEPLTGATDQHTEQLARDHVYSQGSGARRWLPPVPDRQSVLGLPVIRV